MSPPLYIFFLITKRENILVNTGRSWPGILVPKYEAHQRKHSDLSRVYIPLVSLKGTSNSSLTNSFPYLGSHKTEDYI